MLIDESPRPNLSILHLEVKIRAYIDAKSFEEIDDAVEALYHGDYIYRSHVLKEIINKDMMKEVAYILHSMGSKVDLVLFQPLNGPDFELKLLIVNPFVEAVCHFRGIIKDGKILKLENCDHTQFEDILGLARLKKNLHSYIEVQDMDPSFNDVSILADTVFDDDLAVSFNGLRLGKGCMRSLLFEGVMKKARVYPHFKFDVIGCERGCFSRLYYVKLGFKIEHDETAGQFHKRTYALTVKNGKIIEIYPCITSTGLPPTTSLEASYPIHSIVE